VLVSFQKHKLAKEFFSSLAQWGYVIQLLWLRTCSLLHWCQSVEAKVSDPKDKRPMVFEAKAKARARPF